MLRDIKFGLRMLLKQPGFTSITVLTLALGIGATATVFSLVEGVLWTNPPYEKPERLVLIPPARTDGQPLTGPRGWTAAQWQEWKEDAKSFERIAAYGWSFNYLVTSDGSESMMGMRVSADYFDAVGMQPILGRAFLPAETTFPTRPVIILGHDLWQRQFNGDPDIVGKTVRISRTETPPTVVGVMPAGARFLPDSRAGQEPNYDVDAQVDYWMPAAANPENLKRGGWQVMGRLKDGAQREQAQSELAVIAERQAQTDPDLAGFTPSVRPLVAELNSAGARVLWPLFGAAALVLLIACGNAASLMLVRGLQRQREYAVRNALGIGRFALFRQVSVESLLLALVGGGLGIALAFGIVRVFKLIGGHAIPRLDAVTAGWPVLLCGLGSAILAALLAGLIPALRASALDPVRTLKGAGPNASAGLGERRLLRIVTIAQTALTLVLLVGAGLLIRTMVNLANVQSGYRTDRILTMSVTAIDGNWRDFHERALEKVAELPGVERAAFAWGVPLTGNNWPGSVEIEGQPAPASAAERVTLPMRSVTPDYFDLIGLRIADGRGFRASDVQEAPGVAVVNQAFVESYFPGAEPIGKKIWTRGRDNPPLEIVGVVNNARSDDLTAEAKPEIYLSFWQNGAFTKHLVVRTASEPTALAATIERELRAIDPTAAIENVKTLDQIRGDSVASQTFAMQLLVGFSIVGCVLTLIGIYGTLALSVGARTRELAIRAAVGAERRHIRNLIFNEGFHLIGGGVIAGLAAAIAVSRLLRAFLFEIEPGDPATLLGVAALFVAVALLACWSPTRRAAGVNPVEALKSE